MENEVSCHPIKRNWFLIILYLCIVGWIVYDMLSFKYHWCKAEHPNSLHDECGNEWSGLLMLIINFPLASFLLSAALRRIFGFNRLYGFAIILLTFIVLLLFMAGA